MTLLVPSLSYTGAVLTENAFYPLFLLALLGVARAVRRPTVGTQALALVALGLVASTRIQGVALLAGYAGAVLTYALTTSRSDRLLYLRRFVPTALVAMPVALGPVIASLVRGDGMFGWLGQRSGTFDQFRAHEVPQWVAFLAAGLVLYVAVVPAVATAVMVRLASRGRRMSRYACSRPSLCRRSRRCSLSVAFVSALVRCRRDRQPERALRLPRRPAHVRRARSVDRARAPASTTLGVDSARRLVLSPRRSCRSTGSTTTPVSRRWLCSRGAHCRCRQSGAPLRSGQ